MANETTDRQTDSRDPTTLGDDFIFPFSTNRRLPDTDGIYIEGKINGTDVHFTADTGASTSILSYKLYKEIPEDNKPMLAGTSALKGAGGSLIPVYGNGIFELELGPVKLTRNLLVADIEDDVLLGIDILMDEKKEELIFYSQKVLYNCKVTVFHVLLLEKGM
jgi:hypothetical protein